VRDIEKEVCDGFINTKTLLLALQMRKHVNDFECAYLCTCMHERALVDVCVGGHKGLHIISNIETKKDLFVILPWHNGMEGHISDFTRIILHAQSSYSLPILGTQNSKVPGHYIKATMALLLPF
jgi:hypothetical protein